MFIRWTLCREKADVVSNRNIHGEIASDWALGMGRMMAGDGGGGGAGRGGSLRNTDTQATQDVATLWGLPLQFHFCGPLAGSSQSQRPHCAQCLGLCGRLQKGSIKGLFSPVVAAGLRGELLALSQPPCACPPNTPGRQRRSGLRRWGCRQGLPEASWSLSPREGEAATSGRMCSTTLYPLEQSSRATLSVWVSLCFCVCVSPRPSGGRAPRHPPPQTLLQFCRC